MAKKPGKKRPDEPQPPKNLPVDPPLDDIQDIVEFVDDEFLPGDVVADDPVFTFADDADFDPPAPQASDSVPHVPHAYPQGKAPLPPRPLPKETDSVLEDDLVSLAPMVGLDANQVSGIFSSVIRQEHESAVLSNSEIIRAEPLSETIALDPISGIVTMKTDSDVRAVDSGILSEAIDVSDSDVVENAVLESEVTGVSTSEIALPESAVRDENSTAHEDAIGQEMGPSITDSSVSLKSFRRAARLMPEKEFVLDLDDPLAGVDSPEPKANPRADATAAYEAPSSSDDIDFDELLVEDDHGGSAVNFGQKPPRGPSASGIDPVAEALESGVRLDEAGSGVRRSASPPSVEFDDLIIEDDDIAAVDLGAEDSPRPQKASAKLPKGTVEDVSEILDDVVDVDEEVVDVEEEVTEAEQPAVVVEDDVDISELLGDEPTDVGPVVEEAAYEEATHEEPAMVEPDLDEPVAVEDEVAPLVEEMPVDVVEPEPEPTVTSPRRGKRPEVSAVPAPYVEPQKRGWGGLIGGVVLGALLTAGAGAGVWYGAPELLPTAPNTTNNPIVKVDGKAVKATPLQAAREALDEGKFADAIAQLKDATDDKAALVVRGEARWLAYLQKQTAEQMPLDADNEDARAAIEDLTKSENVLKLQQARTALQSVALKADADEARKAEKKLTDDLAAAKAEKDMADVLVMLIEKTLRSAKLLTDEEKIDAESVKKFSKGLGEASASLAEVNKLLDDAKIDGIGSKGVEKLLAAKKDFEDKFADVNKVLADEKVKDSGAKGLAEVLANRDKLAKDRDDLDRIMKEALQELADAKLVPADADAKTGLIAGAKAARTRTESPLAGPLGMLAETFGSLTASVGDAFKGAHDNAAVLAEINFYRLKEAFVPTPEQQLDRLAAALANRDEKNPVLIADANRLAEWTMAQDVRSSRAAKAKALYVQGLGKRNQQQFAEARDILQKAAELTMNEATDQVPWAGKIRQAYAELTDPSVYYIPRIEKLRSEGNGAAAFEELNAALVVIPNHPRLQAERGNLSLDDVKGNLDEVTRAVIRADAEAAAANPKTAASGNFVLGRLEEQSGNLAKAEEFFRQALKSVTADDDQASQIRLRLGRLLLKDRNPGAAPAAPPAPKVEEKDVHHEDVAPNQKVTMVHPLSGLVVAATLSQAASADEEASPEVQARVKESIELARQLLNSKDKKIRAQGHMLLGEAYSRLGQRTEGLREYAKGLELLNPEIQFSKLLEEHPAFSMPADTFQRANPLLAERHYGAGLHSYHQNRFAEAANEFRQAISYFDKDARYYYFLGLCEFEQGKRNPAFQAWEQANRLENNSRPSSREVNLALERIQGERRAFLNSYRGKVSGQQ